MLVPQQAEQSLNALRVVELGAGLMLKKRQVNQQTLRSHAARLLAELHFKVQTRKIGDAFRAARRVIRSVDDIDTLRKNL